MKKILVPCDFSKAAINAFRFALDLAAQSSGTVYLLHAIELPVLHDSLLMPVLNFEEELLKELKEHAANSFEKTIKKYAGETKVQAEVIFGPIAGNILQFINDKQIDVVIMGSNGTAGLHELFIGSNAEKIVRRSTVPVFVIKDYRKPVIKKIVFPHTMGIEDQEGLMSKVKALQHFFKAHLHVVWINTPLNFSPDRLTETKMEAFAKRFLLKDFTLHKFNSLDEETGILEFNNKIKGDLIAMGTHGRKGISHLFNGSIAEDIANHTHGLVWTYSLANELVHA